MKTAFLITAYNNPAHLERLVRAIVTPKSAAFVHVDAKFDLAPFERCQRAGAHFVVPRVAVYWGEFTMVTAVLRLMESALASPERFDYLVLMSGTDYPLRPIEEFMAHLAANAGTQFMNIVKMPDDETSKPLSRLRHYKVLSGDPLAMPLKIVRRALIRARLLPAQRNFETALQGRQPYAGSTWWALTREACEYVLDNCTNYGDTLVPVEELGQSVCPASGISASYLLWAVQSTVIEELLAMGIKPGVYVSNHMPGAAEANQRGLSQYEQLGY